MRRLQVAVRPLQLVCNHNQPTTFTPSLFLLCLLLMVDIRPMVVVIDPMVVIAPMVTWVQCTVHILNIKGAEDPIPRSQVRVTVPGRLFCLFDVRSILSLSLRQC
jgi:hypothetical protein